MRTLRANHSATSAISFHVLLSIFQENKETEIMAEVLYCARALSAFAEAEGRQNQNYLASLTNRSASRYLRLVIRSHYYARTVYYSSGQKILSVTSDFNHPEPGFPRHARQIERSQSRPAVNSDSLSLMCFLICFGMRG